MRDEDLAKYLLKLLHDEKQVHETPSSTKNKECKEVRDSPHDD
jgi:hypothetical protein